MKLRSQALARFLRAPDPAVAAALVYGPDGGLVKEHAAALVAAVAGDAADPFRVSEIAAAALEDDPALLADEAAALTLTGGRRAVRLREAGDAAAPLLAPLLAAPPPAFLVVEAGELGPRSPLRTLFEAHAHAVAIACYHDAGESLGAMIAVELKRAGLAAAPDALQYLAANLGGDRALTRRELEKLALYMADRTGAAKGPVTVTLDDAMAVVGDTAALGLDDLMLDLAEGTRAAVERGLERQLAEGAAPVGLVRAAARHFLRLHVVAGALARGEDAERAMAALRPPVFFRHRPRMRRQAERWRGPALAEALLRLTRAEIDCKTTGLPAETICRRVLAEIALGPAHLAGGMRRGAG
ncbi:MAG: DNA polymerase III subunit delta [Rhodospirillaceae bacterium]|nr:DNA polymerase III subunit delta [Rhodospirillaceae bacterium]